MILVINNSDFEQITLMLISHRPLTIRCTERGWDEVTEDLKEEDCMTDEERSYVEDNYYSFVREWKEDNARAIREEELELWWMRDNLR